MACGCGAKATYKAEVGSFLHADYCDDSALVIAAKKKAAPVLKCAGWHNKDLPAAVSVSYPNVPAMGHHAGQTKHWCDKCCDQFSIMRLNKSGCIVKKAGTDEILRP